MAGGLVVFVFAAIVVVDFVTVDVLLAEADGLDFLSPAAQAGPSIAMPKMQHSPRRFKALCQYFTDLKFESITHALTVGAAITWVLSGR